MSRSRRLWAGTAWPMSPCCGPSPTCSARCEHRIQGARDTGLRNLPVHDTAQNQIWLELVSIALDLLAWMPMIALTGDTRRWGPRRLRLRLLSAAAQLVNTGRRRWLRFTTDGPGLASSPWQSTGCRASPTSVHQPLRPSRRPAQHPGKVEPGAHRGDNRAVPLPRPPGKAPRKHRVPVSQPPGTHGRLRLVS